MNVNANELRSHMNNIGLDKIAVDVIDTNVPNIEPGNNGYIRQKPRVLAKRLIITDIVPGNANRPPQISYSMYNSFKKSNSYVPMNFMFSVILGAEQDEIIAEFDAHKTGLEKSFRDVFNEVHEQIQFKLKEAHELIKEAEQLSNDHGVPFSPSVDLFPVSSSYMPSSFRQKFGDSEEIADVMNDLTGVYSDVDSGWSGAWDSSSSNC